MEALAEADWRKSTALVLMYTAADFFSSVRLRYCLPKLYSISKLPDLNFLRLQRKPWP